ncbi:MAG: hypothetical protein ABR563_12260, partial [Pyrinomonadaceae bacterium]
YALAAAALFLLTLCLSPTVAHYVFVINQRNAWQIAPVFYAWWGLRRVCAYHFGGARAPRPAALGWRALAFASAFLAVWTSPLAAPPLCVIYLVELLRARLAARATSGASASSVAGARIKIAGVLASCAPLVAALVCEQLLKWNFHRHALKHFGSDYRTPLEFDRGNFSANFRAQWQVFAHTPSPWWQLALLGALATLPLAYLLLRCSLRDDDKTARACEPGARLDLCALAVGCGAFALANFSTTVVFTWTRLNAYGGRYLALTHLFGAFAGLVALCFLLNLSRGIYGARRVAANALAALAALLLLIRFPPARKDPGYEPLRAAAASLAARAPRAVLLGGYWDTYVFAGLEPSAAFTPVPAEDQLVRTPWTPRLMRQSGRVLVVQHAFPATNEPETPAPYTTFGDGTDPPSVIRQHGATLRLETPRWFEQSGYVFSLYRVTNEGG